MRILVLIVAGLLTACATTTLTEDEYVACRGDQHCLVAALADKVEQEQWAAEDRRILRKEEIISYILACHYSGHVMFYKKWSGGPYGQELIDRHGFVHVPKHASIQDFRCVRNGDVRQVLKNMGVGSNDRRMPDWDG